MKNRIFIILCGALILGIIFRVTTNPDLGIQIFGIPAEFFLFGLTLLGVALYHEKTLEVAVSGLTAIVILKLFTDKAFSPVSHMQHEASILINLLGLLLGFAVLAKQFESSNVPEIIPKILPVGILGPFVLLLLIWTMSGFLDNIAAAMIGGTIAITVFRNKIHIGYIAAIVAASNAGGAGSVLGDTTTTMMWIEGKSPLDVAHAYVASFFALIVFGFIASYQQIKYQEIQAADSSALPIDWKKIGAVVLILVGTIATNILLDFPAIGVWAAIFISSIFTITPWKEVGHAVKGSLFLITLVLCASLMPVESLPPASWQSAFVLGFVSSVFDNIPLTKLALQQGGYDWGVLAFSVGFGGSMIWFGSSAGVAIANIFPQAKSVGNWLKNGWHIPLAYVIGFFIMLWFLPWTPKP